MNADTLWSSILQAAVQGKLVPQDSRDVSAYDFMNALTYPHPYKEKKIPSRIEFRNNKWFELTGSTEKELDVAFTIPSSWTWVRIKQLGRIVGGGTPKTDKDEYWGGDINWIAPADMKFVKGKYVSRGQKTITEKGLAESSAQLMPAGSVVYSSRAPIGYVAIALNELCTNQGFKSIVPHMLELNDYLYYALQAFTPSIIKEASGTTFKEISGSDFGNVLLPLPPLNEQKRIVAKLEELKPLVERYGRYQTRLSELNASIGPLLKKSILQAAIQGKLVPQDPKDGSAFELMASITKLYPPKNKQLIDRIVLRGDKWFELMGDVEKELDLLFSIPSSWTWVRIRQLGRIVGGGTPKTDKTEYWGGDINWITPADMKYVKGEYVSRGQKTITEKGLAESSAQLMPAGSVVYSSRAPIGYVAIASNEICTNQGFKSIVPYVLELSEYLYYALQAFTPLIIKEASGTTFKEISGSDFGNILLPLPPLAEQHRIVLRIRQLNEILDNFGGKIA